MSLPHTEGAGASRAWSRADVVTRAGKIRLLQLRRLAAWVARPEAFPAPALAGPLERFPHVVGSVVLPLRRTDPHAQVLFEEGKRHNVALAAPAFDGLLISAERPFSFWRALGPATEAAGFREGMELQGGCVVPAMGGGLCLLSNALFELAARAGWRILERHGHTQQAAPTPAGALFGLDATVLYPYVDLRFAPVRGAARLSVRVEGDALRVEARADTAPERVALAAVGEEVVTEAGERYRINTIERSRFDASGRRTAVETLATNRKRLLREAEQSRSCLTCGELACKARRVPGAGG